MKKRIRDIKCIECGERISTISEKIDLTKINEKLLQCNSDYIELLCYCDECTESFFVKCKLEVVSKRRMILPSKYI